MTWASQQQAGPSWVAAVCDGSVFSWSQMHSPVHASSASKHSSLQELKVPILTDSTSGNNGAA